MTTPTGTISLNDVNVELGLSGTTNISMNQANVRTLAGVGGSGTIISMNDLRGKSNRVSISYTFSSNTANASLNLSAISGYVSGKSDITITINSGVYLYATSTSNAGLTLTGGTSGDTLTIVNNGFIMGMGGAGGGSTTYVATVSGQDGGTALSIPISATINNTNGSAYIGGGGGGGCGYGVNSTKSPVYQKFSGGGGGAGGGNGGAGFSTLSGTWSAPATSGGAIGSSGQNGTASGTGGVYGGWATSGGAGGRIMPGSNTSVTRTLGSIGITAALGGSGGGTGAVYVSGSSGGPTTSTGGGANNPGSFSVTGAQAFAYGSGGGYGASGSLRSTGGGTAGIGGKAVQLNGNSVTWVSGNTSRVYGAVA